MFIYKKDTYLRYLVILCLFISSCDSKHSSDCFVCPEAPTVNPNINIRIVDKVSGQDLFFGSQAPYKIAQLKLYHLVNGNPDTVLMRVDTINHYFNINIAPVHNVDTVTMQIANKTLDIFLFKTTIIGKCCSRLVFNSVLYNGNVVYTPANGPNVVVLTK